MTGKYEDIIRSGSYAAGLTEMPSEFLMESHGDLSVYYAPVDYTNAEAKVVICGITPGLQQAILALSEVSTQMELGVSFLEAKIHAKKKSAFGGPMRKNLVRILDFVGINEKLGVSSATDLFASSSNLVHFTSALRYPVFKSGKNYSGTPSMTNNPMLRKQLEKFLLPQLEELSPQAIYIPLGPKVENALSLFVKSGTISESQILGGLPHPSGANAERISYFLNEKPAGKLSAKTNPGKIDEAREKALAKVESMST